MLSSAERGPGHGRKHLKNLVRAYSPDLNSIEEAWSKIKEALRAAAARTREAVEAAFAEVFERITAQDAHGWFWHRGGYVPAPN